MPEEELAGLELEAIACIHELSCSVKSISGTNSSIHI